MFGYSKMLAICRIQTDPWHLEKRVQNDIEHVCDSISWWHNFLRIYGHYVNCEWHNFLRKNCHRDTISGWQIFLWHRFLPKWDWVFLSCWCTHNPPPPALLLSNNITSSLSTSSSTVTYSSHFNTQVISITQCQGEIVCCTMITLLKCR